MTAHRHREQQQFCRECRTAPFRGQPIRLVCEHLDGHHGPHLAAGHRWKTPPRGAVR